MLKKGSKKRKRAVMGQPEARPKLKYPMRHQHETFIQPVFDRSFALLDGNGQEQQPWFSAMRQEMDFA